MSHIVEVKTECRDPAAVAAACARMGLPPPARGTARLIRRRGVGPAGEARWLALPGRGDTATGAVRYDNYGGAWGEPAELGRFLQAYAVAKATAEARRRGHAVAEQALPDGSIRLSIAVGGRA